MSHTPTDEQSAIIGAHTRGGDLVIEAGAGTGKTSTLKMLAAESPYRSGIYLAYNRAIADDAKRSFPTSVLCATAHSLAFRAVGRQFSHRLNGPRMPAHESARFLNIFGNLILPSERVLTPPQQARLVLETVNRFCYSADAAITDRHVPVKPGLDDQPSLHVLRALLPPLARRAWQDLTSSDGRLKFQHDHYLKVWQLSGPVLPCEYVMLDEAQDANPVVADIVARQTHAQRILVGDRSQAIYGWRGAIDAMSRFDGERLQLSQSFRFGPAVAEEANKWLTLLGAELRLRGYERINSALHPLAAPDAILCRSNAEAIGRVIEARAAGRRAALVGGGDEIRRFAEAAITLKAGTGTNHPELFAFKTWGELQDYVENDEGGSDLKVFVRLIDTYGAEKVIATCDQLAEEASADVVVSTAHKAKGREWSSVQVASDFKRPLNAVDLPREESMLAYVTVTRAQHELDRQGLAWVDEILQELGFEGGDAAA